MDDSDLESQMDDFIIKDNSPTYSRDAAVKMWRKFNPSEIDNES